MFSPRRHTKLTGFSSFAGLAVLLVSASLSLQCRAEAASGSERLPGLSYTNYRAADVPWSIHVVKVARHDTGYRIASIHASRRAIGLETLSEQLASLPIQAGKPLGAINGDFYLRDKTYAGLPRGLQVTSGEMLSAPSGSSVFWEDALGEPHAADVVSRLQVSWPGGNVSVLGLNGERSATNLELYTAAAGTSTHTLSGREFVLGRTDSSRWLPLRVGQSYTAKVLEVREQGDTPLTHDTMVLSAGPALLKTLPLLQTGAVLHLSTATSPALHGIRTALSGGPILLRQGRRVKLPDAGSEAYEFSSREERHPRSAIGWNDAFFFLVEVDGRQKTLSIGMTLDELAGFLKQLGCTDAMNLDGGGSATLWYDGSVRNSPCDRAEREIANCLVILDVTETQAKSRTGGQPGGRQ